MRTNCAPKQSRACEFEGSKTNARRNNDSVSFQKASCTVVRQASITRMVRNNAEAHAEGLKKLNVIHRLLRGSSPDLYRFASLSSVATASAPSQTKATVIPIS